MAFSKDNSIQVKGVAILCMIAFHLWGFPERIPSDAVHPWFGSPITKALQICVPIYLFIAGYGLQCIANKSTITWKGVAERLRKLYVSYWWVTVPFIALGFITGYYAFDIKELLGNLTGLSSSYNGEWWFYSLYVELLIIFYFISRIRLEWKGYLCLMVAILIATRGANSFLALDSSVMYQRHLKMILIDLNIFMLGCFFSKFDVFQYIQTKYEWLLNRTSGALLCLIVPILVRAYLPLIGITELIFVPIFILGIINIYKWGGYFYTLWEDIP